jgi:predicted phosphohydrolase
MCKNGALPIADLHLSEIGPKTHGVFGGAWENYREKIITNFQNTIESDDVLVLPGDVTWGINLDEALSDFKLLSSFPGKEADCEGKSRPLGGYRDKNEAVSEGKTVFLTSILSTTTAFLYKDIATLRHEGLVL